MSPLDVIKVRSQAATENGAPKTKPSIVVHNGLQTCLVPRPARCQASTNSVFMSARNIVRTEGVSGLYRGLAPTLLQSIPNVILYYSCYDKLRMWGKEEGASGFLKYIGGSALLAGGAARVVSTSIVSPLELVKTRQMNSTVPTSMAAEFKSIIGVGGFSGLWRGARVTLARDVPFSAVYWVVVESVRESEAIRELGKDRVGGKFLTSLLSGAAGGIVATLISTPMDVIKTRQQVSLSLYGGSNPQIFSMMKNIYEKEGLEGGLWRGNSARLARVVPSCAIMLGSFE
eukprot:CAMPEP_0118632678 /NCGR_PEP_ID=MMETSP0785-20121206/578_1 /TAXON_ID=91992 /ORGANISM="Bolidomonas pacifica, Strain CCMP 1866" /LENGTH=286 /DNA_ID=CAMNT_0006523475 /DNA_START=153 /DNA_END=1010 /DNA_ORIENTATION=-